MSAIQEPFVINYLGVSIQVTPLVDNGDMKYIVELPTRTIILEKEFSEEDIDYWIEAREGQTSIAEEIGRLIESRLM